MTRKLLIIALAVLIATIMTIITQAVTIIDLTARLKAKSTSCPTVVWSNTTNGWCGYSAGTTPTFTVCPSNRAYFVHQESK